MQAIKQVFDETNKALYNLNTLSNEQSQLLAAFPVNSFNLYGNQKNLPVKSTFFFCRAFGEKKIETAVCGAAHTIVKTEGHNKIFAFGKNDKGQLGIGKNNPAVFEPIQVQ